MLFSYAYIKSSFWKFFSNRFNPVPDGIAPVIPIIFVSCSACLIKVSAKTFVYDGVIELDLDCSPVETLNLETPWYLSPESSAGL